MQRQSTDSSDSSAVAFYHEKGFVPAFKQANRFAGEQGRLATMPDVIAARLATEPGTPPWEMYFTTMSAEYRGLSRAGNEILIVAHGIGPMANLNGILLAYGHEFSDKTRGRRGGRITQDQFKDLESGKYGDVAIVDLQEYRRRYEYPFIQALLAREAIDDPLVKARLGNRAEEYITAHTRHAVAWHQEQSGVDEENRFGMAGHAEYNERRKRMHEAHTRLSRHGLVYVLELNDAANCPYVRPLEEGLAFAHLLSIGRLVHLNHEGWNRSRHQSLISDVSCHEWWNGVRLIGIRGTDSVSAINEGANDLGRLMEKHWRKLMRPTGLTSLEGFFPLIQFGGKTFTLYAKQGDGLDTVDPEYLVVQSEKVLGGPSIFRTTVGGYHGLFKYGIREVRRIAPPKANAYRFAGEVQIEWKGGNPTHHVVPIEFYRVEVDASKRLPRAEEVRADYDLMMSLTDAV